MRGEEERKHYIISLMSSVGVRLTALASFCDQEVRRIEPLALLHRAVWYAPYTIISGIKVIYQLIGIVFGVLH